MTIFSYARFCVYVSDKGSKVIGISDEFVPSFLQLLVQFVEHDVGQQRRNWATLGSSFVSVDDHAVDHCPGVEVSAYQFQYAFVLHPRCQSAHQPVVIHPVEANHDTLPTSTVFLRELK